LADWIALAGLTTVFSFDESTGRDCLCNRHNRLRGSGMDSSVMSDNVLGILCGIGVMGIIATFMVLFAKLFPKDADKWGSD
jgi:hypothetical protein